MIAPASAASAARLASECGVTRVAEITYLDDLGVPVFQAVRPWSRGLCVHQGKGLTAPEAALGAAMEAIEQHHAEVFSAPSTVAAFVDLPSSERTTALSDFASDRAVTPSPDEPLAWVRARTLDDRSLWAPLDVVSLDFSRRGDPRLARSSDGLASRFDLHEAFATGLLELIERDAVTRFLSGGPISRMLARIDLETVRFGWLTTLRERLDDARVVATIYRAPAVVPAATFVCEMLEPAAGGALRSAVWGSGCHPCPETALEKAVLEAAQSRLTAISGARDDFLPEIGVLRAPSVGFSLPAPSSHPGLDWSALIEGREVWEPTAAAVVSRLTNAGYPDCAFVELSAPGSEIAVVKAVAPGLGSGARSRRIVPAS